MPKLRVEESLSQITGALEALVEAKKAIRISILQELHEKRIHMFHDRRNPKGSCMFRFGANIS
jgi:hypothetical protein